MTHEPKTYNHIRCAICGTDWPSHDPACAGERHRPPSARIITDTERLNFVFAGTIDYFRTSGVLFLEGEKAKIPNGDFRAAIDELMRRAK